MKFLVLIMTLVQELQLVQQQIGHCNYKSEFDDLTMSHPSDSCSHAEPTIFSQKIVNLLPSLQVLEVNFTFSGLGVCIFEHFFLFINQ